MEKKINFVRCQKLAKSKGLILERIKPEPYISLINAARYQLKSPDSEPIRNFKTLKQVIQFLAKFI